MSSWRLPFSRKPCDEVDPDGDGVCRRKSGHKGEHERAFDKTWPLTKDWGRVTGVLRWVDSEECE